MQPTPGEKPRPSRALIVPWRAFAKLNQAASFLLGWNEFLFSLILTSSSATRTLPVVVAGFVTDRGVAWGEMSAGGVLIALPVIIFALLVQKYFVRGLTMGAVKG